MIVLARGSMSSSGLLLVCEAQALKDRKFCILYRKPAHFTNSVKIFSGAWPGVVNSFPIAYRSCASYLSFS
ncbi:hypothetical protein F4678DRAFT_390673 [Xylaria arbuscula]|nr:hypothetical protein F4678DRAFT_390673 [Xylaria arbuscula]